MAKSQWFRLYEELLDDPKVQRLEPSLFKFLINLWCVASANEPRGVIPPIEKLKFRMREADEGHLRCTLDALFMHGLIDQDCNQHSTWYAVHGWTKRQYKSDTSTERVKRFRDVSRNVSRNVSETPPESERKKESYSESVGEERRVLGNHDFSSDDGTLIILAEEFETLAVECPSLNNIRGLVRHACRTWLSAIEPERRKDVVFGWLRKREREKVQIKKLDEKPKSLTERLAEAKARDEQYARVAAVYERQRRQRQERKNGSCPPEPLGSPVAAFTPRELPPQRAPLENQPARLAGAPRGQKNGTHPSSR